LLNFFNEYKKTGAVKFKNQFQRILSTPPPQKKEQNWTGSALEGSQLFSRVEKENYLFNPVRVC
jgi:hypothetical protein